MEIYHLEKNIKKATKLSEINGVYWSARDMKSNTKKIKSWFRVVGNHHFFTFIYDSKEQADRLGSKWAIPYQNEENDNGLKIYFSTIGVKKSDGKVYIYFKNKTDNISIHEIASLSEKASIMARYSVHAASILLFC